MPVVVGGIQTRFRFFVMEALSQEVREEADQGTAEAQAGGSLAADAALGDTVLGDTIAEVVVAREGSLPEASAGKDPMGTMAVTAAEVQLSSLSNQLTHHFKSSPQPMPSLSWAQ